VVVEVLDLKVGSGTEEDRGLNEGSGGLLWSSGVDLERSSIVLELSGLRREVRGENGGGEGGS